MDKELCMKHEIRINGHLWKGAYPCPNPQCTSKEGKMWAKVSKSSKYWRYICWCGTELRIPKQDKKEKMR